MRYVTGLSGIKGGYYCTPPVRTSMMTNQGNLWFRNRSVIIMYYWNTPLEESNLELFWMVMTPSLMIIQMVIQRVTLMNRNTKDYHIPMIYLT